MSENVFNIHPTNPGDYPEDFEWDNGNYWHICNWCEKQFSGHKRRRMCKVCNAPIQVNPMTKLAELCSDISTLKHNLSLLVLKVKPYLTDTTISLDGRWAAFERISESLPTKSYGTGYLDILNPNYYTMYDDFGIDRYQTVSYSSMLEKLLDEEFVQKQPDDNINGWKEAVLAAGNGSFVYDW